VTAIMATLHLSSDTPVLVLGLGASGLAMARWAARAGAPVRVWDSRTDPPQAEALAAQVPQAERLVGPLDECADDAAIVLKSPGLAPHDPRIAPLLERARARGARIAGELDLFADALVELHAARDYAPKVVAVTGTNGKTTTTAMVAQLVARTGKRVAAAGNIGPTMLQTLADAVDAGELPDVWVLELSSFQLDGVEGFEPTAAALLNVTEDHLDWHGSMAAYAATIRWSSGSPPMPLRPRSHRRSRREVRRAAARSRARAPASRSRAASCASASARRVPPATSASSSSTAWRGSHSRCRPTTVGAAMLRASRAT